MSCLLLKFNLIILLSPLEQFELIPGSVVAASCSFLVKIFLLTNSNFYCLLSLLYFWLFAWNFKYYGKIFPKNFQLFIESCQLFIAKISTNNIIIKKYVHFPLLFLLFYIILFLNLLGMISYTFTVTSHFFITFFLSFSIFAGLNILGIKAHGLSFFSLFMPSGAPLLIRPFLLIIEYISYFARVFSLAIRLFANMMAGHTLLKILSGFVWVMISNSSLFACLSIFPTILIVVINGLEVAIAFLQAYVFTVLVAIYINDALNLH